MTQDTETPAAWHVTPKTGLGIHGQSIIIDENTGANIAVVYGDSPDDAPLIAAAPALADALRKASNLLHELRAHELDDAESMTTMQDIADALALLP